MKPVRSLTNSIRALLRGLDNLDEAALVVAAVVALALILWGLVASLPIALRTGEWGLFFANGAFLCVFLYGVVKSARARRPHWTLAAMAVPVAYGAFVLLYT